jgi:hypothetical protein
MDEETKKREIYIAIGMFTFRSRMQYAVPILSS